MDGPANPCQGRIAEFPSKIKDMVKTVNIGLGPAFVLRAVPPGRVGSIFRRFRAARNVYDIDSVQLVQAYASLNADGALVGAEGRLA